MKIDQYKEKLNPSKSFVDPLSRYTDGEYKVKVNGVPDFYDSEDSSSIDYHLIIFKDDGTSQPVSKKRFLNNQYAVDLTAANFMQAGIDVSHWATCADLAVEFRRACEKLANKVLMIRKYSRPKKDNPTERFHDFDIIGVSKDVPVTSHEEELPF
jgi:hypothetical protein